MSETFVEVRDFKTNLARYLQRVEAGESLVITSHGRAIGRLIPTLPIADEASVDARIADMVATGFAEWNGERFIPEASIVEGPEDFSLSAWIVDEREASVERLL